jgi:hypothetical protein
MPVQPKQLCTALGAKVGFVHGEVGHLFGDLFWVYTLLPDNRKQLKSHSARPKMAGEMSTRL